jgi:hypothetical protein
MNRNVGASFSLSVLTVLAFAVALYQPDTPPPPATTNAPSGPGRVPAPIPAAPAAPEVVDAHEPPPDANPVAPIPRPQLTSQHVSRPVPKSVAREPSSAARREHTAARTVARRQVALAEASAPAPEPRGAFTRVRRGESLADVARRVYGSDGAAEDLWKSNRDLLDHEDAPLREGELLRTP